MTTGNQKVDDSLFRVKLSLLWSGEIRIFNRKKADIAQKLRQRGFTPFPKKATVSGTSDAADESEDESDYEYLRKLTMEMFSVEKTEELCAEIDKTKEQVEYLKKATPRSLWLRDLESLDMELDKLDLKDAQDEEERNVWCQRDHRERQ